MNITIEINTDGEYLSCNNSTGVNTIKLYELLKCVPIIIDTKGFQNPCPINDPTGNRCGTVTITESE